MTTTADPAPPAPARHRRLAVALVAAIAALVLVGVGTLAFRGTGDKPSGTSTEPTSFVLPALNGDGQVKLADFRGKPTVVNLFASWCDVCDLELPDFAKASKALDGKVRFVGVASMETGDANLMPNRHHLTGWTLARDVGGSNGSGLHDALAPSFGMPITAFYDADGKLVYVQKGGLAGIDLQRRFEEVLDLSFPL